MEHKDHLLVNKITNGIVEVATGKSFSTEILAVKDAGMKGVLMKNGWFFNWRKELKIVERQLYKLVIDGDSIIQGLISLEPMEGWVEMHLIENAPHNYGAGKQYYGVAGNLIGFACKMSFDLGHEGYVSFTPKTNLVDHYSETLGATMIFRNRMTIPTESARKLVNSYYKDHLK